MNSFKPIKLAVSFVFIGALSACANLKNEAFSTQHNTYQLSKELQLNQRQRADLYEAIITADIAEHNQDHLTAMSYYLFAADMSHNQQLVQKSIDNAKAAKDPLGLQQAAKTWLAKSPQNLQAQTLLLETQIELQNFSEALVTANSILQNLENSQARFEFLETKVLNKDPRSAFNLLRELNKQQPDEVAFIAAQAKFIFKMANSNQNSDKLFIQALQRVEDALDKKPLFNPAIRLKAHILFQTHQDAKARSYLKNLFIDNPNSSDISQMLGQLLYDLRDYEASVSHYANWLQLHPQDLEARNYLAASYYGLGHYQQSLKHFKQLLGTNFQAQIVAFYCGDSAQKTAQYNQAIECFEMVTDGRFLARSKVYLSKLLAKQNKFEAALTTVRKDYKLDEKGTVQLKVAEIDLLNQHFSAEQAKAQLTLALEQTPDNLALILKKIELYHLVKKPDELMVVLTKARSLLEPSEKLDRFNLAVAALLRNNLHYQLAIDWLNHALEVKPQDKELLYTRALYKEPLGLFAEMISEFKYLLTIYPSDLNIKNALGYTLADLGQELDYAQALIDSAYQGLPKSAAVIDSKGWLAYRKGDLNSAEEYLSRAFILSPSAEIAAHLGEILWKKEAIQAAKNVWRKGLMIENNNKMILETLERLKVEL